MSSSDPIGQFTTLITGLAKRKVAYVNVGEPHIDRAVSLPTKIGLLLENGLKPAEVSLRPYAQHIKELGSDIKLFSNGGHTLHSGIRYVEDNFADAVAYGRWFASNADLVERIRKGIPFREYDKETFYTHSKDGYLTFPASEHGNATKDSTQDATHSINSETDTSSTSLPGNTQGEASQKKLSVAIVGAGVSGLSSAAALDRVGGFKVKIFERSSRPGGVWCVDIHAKKRMKIDISRKLDPPQLVDFGGSLRRNDLDAVSNIPDNLPVTQRRRDTENKRFTASPLYETVVTNIPGIIMQGHDESLPAPEKALAPYLTQAQVVAHVKAKAIKHQRDIVLNTHVERVSKSLSGKWEVTLRQQADEYHDNWYNEEFDHIIVASGHNSVPRIPSIPGLQRWKGSLLHSISYRGPSAFTDKVSLSPST